MCKSLFYSFVCLSPFKIGAVFVGVESKVFLVPGAGLLGVINFKEYATNTCHAFHMFLLKGSALLLYLNAMKKGSALLYSGDVIHGGGNNTEDAIRTGFYIGFIPSWLSPLENHVVASGVAAVDKLDEPIQHLLNVVPGGFTVIP